MEASTPLEAAAALTAQTDEGAPFSLELSQDQKDIRDWVHGFAEGVVRPAAAEWDEREETPWPVIQEAANIGLYSMDFIANAFGDPTGITFPMISEELCWGDAGIALAIFGTTLGVSGIVGNGTPEQIGEWLPECFGTPDDLHVAAFAVSEPDAGSDVSSLRTRAEYDEKIRNGEWEYQAFKADKTPNTGANLSACFNCHKPQAGQDFVFSYQSMKTATR